MPLLAAPGVFASSPGVWSTVAVLVNSSLPIVAQRGGVCTGRVRAMLAMMLMMLMTPVGSRVQLVECPSTRIGTQTAARGHAERVGSGTLAAAAAAAGRTVRHRIGKSNLQDGGFPDGSFDSREKVDVNLQQTGALGGSRQMMRTVSKLGQRQELDARNAEISIDGAAASSREPSPVDDAQVDTHEGGVTSWSDRVFLTQNTLSGSGINFPHALEPKRLRSTRRPHTRIGMSDEEERLPQAEVSNVEIHQLPRELLRLMTAGRHPKLEQQILKNSTGRQLEIAFVRAPPEDFEKLIRLTNFGEFDDGSHRKEKTQSVLDDPPSDDEPPLRFSLHSEILREEKEKEKVARPVASVQPIGAAAPPGGGVQTGGGVRRMSAAVSAHMAIPRQNTAQPSPNKRKASFVGRVRADSSADAAGKPDAVHVPAPALPIVAEGSAAVRQTRAKAAIVIGMAYDSVANSLGRSARCRRQTCSYATHTRSAGC